MDELPRRAAADGVDDDLVQIATRLRVNALRIPSSDHSDRSAVRDQ
jgi:hypothetical protein